MDFLDSQINEFYGPLYMLTQAGKSLYDDFLIDAKEKGLFHKLSAKNPNAEWRLWVEGVLVPLNNKIEKIILEKGYLIDEVDLPQCLLDFLIHSAQYKVLIKKWSFNDFTDFHTKKVYPKELIDYIKNKYKEKKEKQNDFREKIFNKKSE